MPDPRLAMTRWAVALDQMLLGDHEIHPVVVDGTHLLLVRDGDRLIACARACPHEQADLVEGQLVDGRLRCPRHLASFDLQTGSISGGFPSRPLRLYPVRVADGKFWVDLSPS